MLTLPEDIKITLKKYLSELNCCKRCTLRYFGFSQFDDGCDSFIYPEKQDIFTSEISDENASKRVKANPCRACLDLLNDSTIKYFIEHLPQGFEEYDIEQFTTPITLPIAISIRERSLFISLKEKFPDIYKDMEFSSIQSVKSVFKISISFYLTMKIYKVSQKAANFQVNINIDYEDEQKETANISKICTKKINRNVTAEALANCKDDIFKTYFPVPPHIQDKHVSFTVTYSSTAVFLGGRYLKFSREMGQSPFVVNNKPITETSVQDILFDSIKEVLRCHNSKLSFSASGREDADTRMLGDGRPFYIQIDQPKFESITEKQCTSIQQLILNSNAVVVVNLQQVTQEETKKIKFGEEQKRKHYRAICKTLTPNVEDAIEQINLLRSPLEIHQATPIRVLHRRSQKIRNRKVFELKASAVEGYPDLFYLDLITEAGTYVKEFVHGDFNRTNPNIAKVIGFAADVVALDVTLVELQWPEDK